VETRQRRLDGIGQLLASLSHKNVLERGFALVRDASGHLVRLAGDAQAAGQVELEFRDGRVAASVGETVAGQTASNAPDDASTSTEKLEKKAPGRKSESKSAASQGCRTGLSAGNPVQDTNKDRQGQLF
jgi:exodeoxyribonuclease VII large subunit